MKDIDFDELDRAVNSLMSPVGTTPTTPAKPAAEPAAQSLSDTEATPEVTSAPVSVPERTATPTPAARRGGRFMDMIHTSSDMKTRSTGTQSREGVAITPARPITQPAAAEPVINQADQVAAIESEQTGVAEVTTPDSPEEMPKAEESIISSSAPESSSSDIVMPDPLDIDTSSQEADTSSEVDEVTTETEESNEAPTSESPFLTDAKVEKRPLNPEPLSSSEPLVDMDALLKEDLETGEAKDEDAAEEKSKDEPPVVPVAPELNSELVAIESGERSEAQPATEDESTAKADEPSTQPTGPTSIAQQYKTQESTGDKSHAAIYDATQYPEPVAHPAKKKSGWLWVVWVIVLLALGAGGAIGLYAAGIIP